MERAVCESARSWTLLRPSWFMQVFTDGRYYRESILGGELPFSSAGARVAWIDTRDIAAVAERAPGRAGARRAHLRAVRAGGLARTAQLLSAALGRPVAHVEMTIEQAVAGMEGFDRNLFAITFERLHAEVTDTVERVTGRPARTLQMFLADSAPLTISA